MNVKLMGNKTDLQKTSKFNLFLIFTDIGLMYNILFYGIKRAGTMMVDYKNTCIILLEMCSK